MTAAAYRLKRTTDKAVAASTSRLCFLSAKMIWLPFGLQAFKGVFERKGPPFAHSGENAVRQDKSDAQIPAAQRAMCRAVGKIFPYLPAAHRTGSIPLPVLRYPPQTGLCRADVRLLRISLFMKMNRSARRTVSFMRVRVGVAWINILKPMADGCTALCRKTAGELF